MNSYRFAASFSIAPRPCEVEHGVAELVVGPAVAAAAAASWAGAAVGAGKDEYQSDIAAATAAAAAAAAAAAEFLEYCSTHFVPAIPLLPQPYNQSSDFQLKRRN